MYQLFDNLHIFHGLTSFFCAYISFVVLIIHHFLKQQYMLYLFLRKCCLLVYENMEGIEQRILFWFGGAVKVPILLTPFLLSATKWSSVD